MSLWEDYNDVKNEQLNEMFFLFLLPLSCSGGWVKGVVDTWKMPLTFTIKILSTFLNFAM